MPAVDPHFLFKRAGTTPIEAVLGKVNRTARMFFGYFRSSRW